jgi:Fe-S oxidoreductase
MRKAMLSALVILAVAAAPAMVYAAKVMVPEGTEIKVKFDSAAKVDSVKFKKGDVVKIILAEDIKIGDKTIVEAGAEGSGRVRPRPDGAEAVLFPTCYVQNNEPQIGRDTLEVMERNGVKTACVKGLQCCGMPAWETGDLETVRRQAANNLKVLGPFVEAGTKVIAINPTCAMMMRREYPELLPEALRPEARRLAELVRDPSEFLWEIRNEPRFNTDFKSTPGGPVAYHAPCHLRAQAVGFKGRDLLRKIPGVQPKLTMECCGHDGTYAMKVEGYENSIKVGKKAFDGMKEAGAEVWATDCPLAALQFQQHAGKKPLHPMSILARAYRADGFPTPVAKDAGKKDGEKG